MTFAELGLKEEIVSAVEKMGFENPTEIQEKAILALVSDSYDFVGLAQTGTGKTAAFGLPMINKIDFDQRHIQGLVIAPTRELCMQITEDLKKFSSKYKKANIVPVYGGANIQHQIKDIKRGAQIVCATPGRLQDMIERKVVRLDDVETVVLDEADEMLNMGFKEDIFNILSYTPDTKNVWLFSATMPNDVIKIRKQFMTDPVEVTVGKRNQAASTVDHFHFVVKPHQKYDALKRLLDFHPNIFGVVFCRTKRDTQSVAEKLMGDGYNAEALHGDLTQGQRDRVMNLFRNKTLNILVATDVAARGIDVNDVTHVIHMGVPDDKEAYNHRSGRTGRAGKTGQSLAIIGPKDGGKIKEIERMINKSIVKSLVPGPKEIIDNQLIFKMNQIHDLNVDQELLSPYKHAVEELFADYSREQLIEKIVTSELKQLLEYYDGAGDINAGSGRDKNGRDRDRGRDRDGRSRKERKERGGDSDSQRLFLNIGSLDGMKRSDVFKLIVDNTKTTKSDIGSIKLLDKFCFVELKTKVGDSIIKKLSGKKLGSRKISVEYASKK